MPQKAIKFSGINRIVNEFQNSGACEELINLRPDVGGTIRVAKAKDIKDKNIQYDQFFEHAWGNFNNEIAVENGVVIWLNKDGGPKIITDAFQYEDVLLSYSLNILLVVCTKVKRQLAFKFVDDEYVPLNYAIKPITDVRIITKDTDEANCFNVVVADDDSVGAYNAAAQKAASGFYNKFHHGLCGAAIVGCTYELEDGNELWSTAFIVAKSDYFTSRSGPVIDRKEKTVKVWGTPDVTLILNFNDAELEGIRKINIYASRPIYPFEVDYNESGEIVNKYITPDEANLGGQLMYYQGSIVPNNESVSFRLSFKSEQAGEKIMDVTSGCIERLGKVISYNNRFHVFSSYVEHIIQVPTVSKIYTGRVFVGDSRYWVAYVKLNNEWKLIDNIYTFSETRNNDFIYPLAGVTDLAFVRGTLDSNYDFVVKEPYSEMFYVKLKDSSAYNYSYAFDVIPEIVSAYDFYETVKNAGQLWGKVVDTKVFLRREPNAINVSAPSNPFVFPVKYSYSFGGEILDIATAYTPISSTQSGQYPITVFTKNGIFALEQGNGDTLYSNIVPLDSSVIDGKATATPHGTFFVSAKRLYLLAGRDAVNISRPLIGEIDVEIRNNDVYMRLYMADNSVLYNFAPLLSKKNFDEFISDAILTYDQINNELIISSTDESIGYSYVFNLDTKTYHKVSRRYLASMNGSRYVIEAGQYERNLVDMHTEIGDELQPIMLQSRPMSLELLYTHIQRLILFVDTKLSGEQNLCLTVFGSDNLHDWRYIVSSQKHNVALRQIRTNKAAKSYKDYVIVISGMVSTNTDISDIIADYTVVHRRLG